MKRAAAKTLRPGEVTLIGAGPGDPGLLTLKGLAALQQADVVLYDNLVHPDILRFAPPAARRIYVGKKGGEASWTQARINELILKESSRGLRIARLKGGDPHLFGRGAEEGVFLRAKGISFRVIPGITSGMACATYAGIPLTERHLGSSVAFLTGHAAGEGKLSSIRWKPLTQAVDTIVVYMGLSKIRDITRMLLTGGLARSTPAAVVEWGTWTRQRAAYGTLGNIAAKVLAQKIASPAIFIVGKVVALHDKLDWFQKLPLFGKTVCLTRAESQSMPLRARLESLGARVIEIHALAIAAPSNPEPLRRAARGLGDFDWIIFASANGVDSFFAELTAAGKDARALSGLRVAAVGASTADKLAARGIRSDFTPQHFTTADLVDELKTYPGGLRGKKFLLVRSQISPPELVSRLEKEGATAVQVTGYETRCPSKQIREELKAALAARPDILTFTSSSTVNHLVDSAAPGDLKRLLKTARVVSIGPVTTSTLKRRKIKVHREAGLHTAEGLAEAILSEIRKK